MSAGDTNPRRYEFVPADEDLFAPDANVVAATAEAEEQAAVDQRLEVPVDDGVLGAQRDDAALSGIAANRNAAAKADTDADDQGGAAPARGHEDDRAAETGRDGAADGTRAVLGDVAIRDGSGHVTHNALELWQPRPPQPADAPQPIKELLVAAQAHAGDRALTGRYADGASLFFVVQTGQMDRRHNDTGEEDKGSSSRKEVPADLGRAQEDPASVVEMIIHTPKSDFELGVERAETDGRVTDFEGRMADYSRARLKGAIGRDGKPVPGFWAHLRWTAAEAETLRRAGNSKGLVKRNNETDIGKVQFAYNSTMNTGPRQQIDVATGGKRTIGAGSWVGVARTQIMKMDGMIRDAQAGARDGLNSVLGSTETQGRLEHLLALRIPHEVGQPGKDGEASKDADQMKLAGLREYIDLRWREAEHMLLRQDPAGYASGETRMVEIAEDLQALEELYTALEIRYTPDRTQKGSVRRHGVIGFHKTRAELLGKAATRRDASEELSGSHGAYTPEQFELDVLDAHMQYVNVLQGRDGIRRAGEHLTRAADQITGQILGRGQHTQLATGQYQHAGRIISAEAAALIGPEGYKEMLTAALRQAVETGGKTGYIQPQLARLQVELAEGLVAVSQDVDGSYAETRQAIESRVAHERVIADNPPEGRRLIVVGDVRPEDGQIGLLEWFALLGGNDQHLDTYGNTPLNNPVFRSQLQAAARQLGKETEIHKPLERIIPGRQWENVHFVGRLPDGFSARHILSPIPPSGFGTMEVESNAVDATGEMSDKSLYKAVLGAINPDPELYDRNPRAFPYAGRFRAWVVPTRVLRVLDHDSDDLAYTLDHADPDLAGYDEHTLALFANNPDGSPSEFYKFLMERVGAYQRREAAD